MAAEPGFLTAAPGEIENVEPLLDRIELADMEWARASWTAELAELRTHKAELRRAVLRAALLDRESWTAPSGPPRTRGCRTTCSLRPLRRVGGGGAWPAGCQRVLRPPPPPLQPGLVQPGADACHGPGRGALRHVPRLLGQAAWLGVVARPRRRLRGGDVFRRPMASDVVLSPGRDRGLARPSDLPRSREIRANHRLRLR